MLWKSFPVLFVRIGNVPDHRDLPGYLLIIRVEGAFHVILSGLIMKTVLDVWVFHSWMKRQYFIRLFLLRKPGTAPIPEMFRERI